MKKLKEIKISYMDKISKRQKELLKIIYEYFRNSEYPPTFEDMKERLGVSSNQTIIDLLSALEKKGFIKREGRSARGLAIKQRGYDVLKKEPLVRVMGATAAGPPITAVEQREWISMPSRYKKLENVFVVKVSGNSMIEADIYDGDYVLIKKQDEYKPDDIVLARIKDDEVTLKTFVYENGRTYLKPENPACRNIPITHDTFFLGKYIGKVQ